MNCFDVSLVVKDMSDIKQQLKTTLSVHAAVCKSEHVKMKKKTKRNNVATPSLKTTEVINDDVPVHQKDTLEATTKPPPETETQEKPESNDDDLLRLASIQ